MFLTSIYSFSKQNTEHLLPNYICERCATNLDVAFKFKRKFEDSILKIIGDVHVPAVVDSSDINRLIKDDIPNQCNTHDENNEQSKVEYVLIEDTKDNVPQPFQLKISAVYQCCPWSTQPSSEESGDVSLNANRLANEIYASDDIPNQFNAHEKNELSLAPHGNKVQSDSTTNNNDYNENCPQMDIANEPEDQIHPMESVANDIQTPVHIESLSADKYNNQSNIIAVEISNQVKVASDYTASRDENQLSSEETRSNHDDEVRLTETSPRRSNRKERKVNPTKSRNQLLANVLTNKSNRLAKIKENRPVNLLTYSNLQISSSTNRETPLHQDLRAIKKKFRSIIVCSVKDIENFDSKLTKKIIDRIYTNHYRKNKPFRCDVCHRWFKTKGHVKTHRMLHIEAEYEIQCGKCQLRFLTKSHFKTHKCNDKVK